MNRDPRCRAATYLRESTLTISSRPESPIIDYLGGRGRDQLANLTAEVHVQ